MKKFMLTVILLMVCSLNAQNTFHKKSVQVLPSSTLTITGDTNIKDFTCNFDVSYLNKPQVIMAQKAADLISFQNAVLALNTKGFDCGSRAINKDFHDLIKSDRYPKILLDMKKVKLTSEKKGVANVDITIAGITRSYQIPVEIKNGLVSEFKGIMQLNINDFNLEAPKKLFGMIVVKDDIQINFDLKIKIEEQL